MKLNYLVMLLTLSLAGCQVLPDKYTQEASPDLVKLQLFGYSTGTQYIGVPIANKAHQYHMKSIEESFAYLKPDSDYALQSSGYVAGGKCGWTYVIHTPKKPQSLTVYSKYQDGKCFASVNTELDNIDQSGFSLRKLAKHEKIAF